MNYYRPQRSWGKVIFSQVSVILSTGGGGLLRGCLLQGGCLVREGVWSGGASSRGVLGEDPPPPGQLLLVAVRILLECILVRSCFPKFRHRVKGYYFLGMRVSRFYTHNISVRLTELIRFLQTECLRSKK